MRRKFLSAVTLATIAGLSSVSYAQEASVPAGSEFISAKVALSSQATVLNQNQWVRLTDDGSVRGSVTMLVDDQHVRQSNVRVALVRDGHRVAEVMTDSEGDFMIEKAIAGSYALVVEGDKQLAVCALTVLDTQAGAHLPKRVDVRTVTPMSQRIAELIRGNTLPTWTPGGDNERDPVADARKLEDSCEVLIDAQGGISGKLSRANAQVDLSSTVVYLVKDGREVARARAKSDGAYRFENVAPGGYGLVASGAEGVAAVGFCAVSPSFAVAKPSNVRLIATQEPLAPPAKEATELNVELAEPNCYVPAEVIPAEECLAEEAAACCPTMGGCCNAGSGGGGGGGVGASGFGNGWAGLAALGALGAIGIIQALDENNQAPVVSPVAP